MKQILRNKVTQGQTTRPASDTVCHHNCRCNDSWENSSRDELAGYKSPLLQDSCMRQNQTCSLVLFAEVYECLWPRGGVWLRACVYRYFNLYQDPFCWFLCSLDHWFVTEQWGIFKTWTDRTLFPRLSLSAARLLWICLSCITASTRH